MKTYWARFFLNLVMLGACLAPNLVFAQCADHMGGYGPYDYTNPVHLAENLEVVERVHFTPQVEGLGKGATGSVGSDLDYTIRAFPNHHRALDALSKLTIKVKSARPVGLRCTAEGYFERAIRFKADDGVVHMIYGLHLYRWKKIDLAKKQFEAAATLAPDDTNIAYNLGLMYADLKEWDKAATYAQKAYGAGFTLPGLKNKLVKVGKWKEPVPVESKPAEVPPAAKNDNPDKLNESKEKPVEGSDNLSSPVKN